MNYNFFGAYFFAVMYTIFSIYFITDYNIELTISIQEIIDLIALQHLQEIVTE